MPSLARDGCQIHFEDVGEGPPLLLVHGAVSSSRSFEEHISNLMADFRVIVPDLRGMGRSTHVDRMPSSAWADDLCALLDHLSIDRVNLCGTSLGARIALRLALRLPTSVASVVADAPLIFQTATGTAALERAFTSELSPDLAGAFERWNGPEWQTVLTNFLAIRLQPGLQEYYDLRGELHHLACPVLVTRGDMDDEIHPLAHAVEVHTQVDASRLWIAPATPFSVARYRPIEFADTVRAFVRECAQAAPEPSIPTTELA
jgi:pimeloyl-ACP methyl ester carboxylesterase